MNSELSYIVFILGYDLLNRRFNEFDLACDEAFDRAEKIAHCFTHSDIYKDMTIGMYSALEKWLENNYDLVIDIIKNG